MPPGFERCIGEFHVGPPPKLPPDGGNAKIKARPGRAPAFDLVEESQMQHIRPVCFPAVGLSSLQ